LSKAVGRRYLEAKLREAGLGAEVARQAAADALDGHREEELALQAAASAWRRQSGSGPRETSKVVRFLVGRGFAPAVASRAARHARVARPPAGLDDD
jgi:SOS response regulatory protein OraA/RecX